MRIGSNPEKDIEKVIEYRQHRIIIPVYIPESKDKYFINLLEIFKFSMESLLKTIDISKTVITIINNNSKEDVSIYINELLNKNKIDKYVFHKKNYGKVYTVLSEARAAYEPIVTIADADVFYFPGWENASIKVLNNYKKVGVVSPLPMPHLSHYNNKSFFADFFLKIKKGKVIADSDLELFEVGVSHPKIFIENENLYKNHFYVEKNKIKSCIGAGHFISTYRTKLLRDIVFEKPKFVFKSGYENEYIDKPIDQLGYYRMSTIKTYVYHLGNSVPKWVENYINTDLKEKHIEYHENVINKQSNFTFSFKALVYKILKKVRWI